MSLINDALKKARHQAEAVKTITDSSFADSTPLHSAKGHRQAAPNYLPWIVVTVLISTLAIICSVLAVVLFYQTPAKPGGAEPDDKALNNHIQVLQKIESENSDVSKVQAAIAGEEKSPAEAIDSPSVPAEMAPAIATHAVTAPVPALKSVPLDAGENILSAVVESATLLREPSATDQIETSVKTSTPCEAVIHWLAESTINGVRISGQQSRIMFNGRSYRLGETVNFELGIIIRAIQESRVLFEDAQGLRYVKHF
jgi:hypothetical protein